MSGTLGIIGVGLIGGSVGLAARDSGWEVVGVDTPQVLEKAAQSGAIHRASTLKEVREADLVVLAAPISKVTDLVGDLTPTNALVTDVASAKSAIVRRAENLKLRFVGGHPMAGSQLSGVANARSNLFEGARYFLTPTDRTAPEDYREVASFVRDLTRVGASNPELWSDILAENAPALGEALGAFAGAMAQLGSEIKDREAIELRFLQAREAYDALGGILVEKDGINVDVAIPVENRPGVFAEVTTLMGSNNINILDLYVRHSNTERAALVLTLDAEAAQEARELLRIAGFTAELQD